MRIFHILRAPVGGLFRHVCDLAQIQAELGHDVGIVCDSESGGDRADKILADLEQYCRLGIHRTAMPRLPGPGDIQALRSIGAIAKAAPVHILHGHGAKGGLYARMIAGKTGAKAIYTPHGGALHYAWNTPQGAIFLGAEKMMLRKTAGLSFVCQFEHDAFERKVGVRDVPVGIVHNGLWPHEFEPVVSDPDATDLLFVGELRVLKGVDVLIDALAQMDDDRHISLTIVGDGADRGHFEEQVRQSNLTARVRFTGALPAQEAFALGRIVVIPSRAESFPYIVLEAIAAGMPVIATRVGGIPEILPDKMLIEANDAKQLACIIQHSLDAPDCLAAAAGELAERASKHLSVYEMSREILAFYKVALGESG
ncbi:MAG: glycosyltransferase family 4 protein [Rhizobiales bacterium]|nr:glycosyltransferase family 4 protein [Hyphomicrobiales bacterium]